MSEKVLQTLEGVPQTLLIPLLARARETLRPDGAIRDDRAVEIASRIQADFPKMVMARHDEVAILARMKRFDWHVRDFLARNPRGVVVHIGCGLDTRFERIASDSVEWFDLDLPEVMELRRVLIATAAPHYHALSASIFENGWLAEVEPFKPRPFLFISEGVFPYFEEAQIKDLFTRLGEHFPACEVVCDAHSSFVIWADNLHLALAGVKARLQWKLKDPRIVETWGADFRLLDEWTYYANDEPLMESYRWLGKIPGLAKSSGIYHYRLGK